MKKIILIIWTIKHLHILKNNKLLLSYILNFKIYMEGGVILWIH